MSNENAAGDKLCSQFLPESRLVRCMTSGITREVLEQKYSLTRAQSVLCRLSSSFVFLVCHGPCIQLRDAQGKIHKKDSIMYLIHKFDFQNISLALEEPKPQFSITTKSFWCQNAGCTHNCPRLGSPKTSAAPLSVKLQQDTPSCLACWARSSKYTLKPPHLIRERCQCPTLT